MRDSTLTERSIAEQVHQANVCLINGEPRGVEPERVRSTVEVLGKMTADPLHQVARFKTRLDPGLDIGCRLLPAHAAAVLVDVSDQRDLDESGAGLGGRRLKRVALIKDRD